MICPTCGAARPPAAEPICPWHFAGSEGRDGFDARANKIWCDYFHRGVEIQKCPEDPPDPTWYGSDIAYDIC